MSSLLQRLSRTVASPRTLTDHRLARFVDSVDFLMGMGFTFEQIARREKHDVERMRRVYRGEIVVSTLLQWGAHELANLVRCFDESVHSEEERREVASACRVHDTPYCVACHDPILLRGSRERRANEASGQCPLPSEHAGAARVAIFVSPLTRRR